MNGKKKKVHLIQNTSKTFLWTSVFLMVVSTIVLYFYVRKILQEEAEEELRSTEARIESALVNNSSITHLPPVVEVKKITDLQIEKLKDTLIFDPSQNEMEAFRELTTYTKINGQIYQITVRALIVETEDILVAIVVSYIIIIFLVFLFLFYFNKAYNQRLWYPFFNNLEQMKHFSLFSDKPILLEESDILEFTELNTEITTLTDKVRSDYKNLKQYTEDVSHEMQTPLAIMQAKIENIINCEDLNEDHFAQLTSVQKDIHRLAQLNKRLALLTRIENQQFVEKETIDLNQVVQKRIDYFNEQFPVEIKFIGQHQILIKMDPYLSEVLCDNLLSNAIKHNEVNGSVQVILEGQTLRVENSGKTELRRPDLLFTRFYRESNEEKSTGLGLAIVQKICGLYGFTPSYSYEEHKHIFKVKFI